MVLATLMILFREPVRFGYLPAPATVPTATASFRWVKLRVWPRAHLGYGNFPRSLAYEAPIVADSMLNDPMYFHFLLILFTYCLPIIFGSFSSDK